MTTRRVLPTRRQVTSRRIRYAAPALEKGLDILELLASVSEALTHSEIASRLGRTINEVFRMLVCLDERGYISRTGPDERYQSSGATVGHSGAPVGAEGRKRHRPVLPSGNAQQC
jgi:IclR helix-turn-helix domain